MRYDQYFKNEQSHEFNSKIVPVGFKFQCAFAAGFGSGAQSREWSVVGFIKNDDRCDPENTLVVLQSEKSQMVIDGYRVAAFIK